MTDEVDAGSPAQGEPKWMTLARAEIGTLEVAGYHDNPEILAYYK